MDRQLLVLRTTASRQSRHAVNRDRLERASNQSQQTAITWNSRPLCCRYLAVVFVTQPMTGREECGGRDDAVRWAIGVLADGEHEVVGVWWQPVMGVLSWQDVFADLRLRGVDKIRFVAGNESVARDEAMRASYPLAKALPSVGEVLRQSLAQVALRDRGSAAQMLSTIRTAGSARAARAALTTLEAGPLGARYPSTAKLWRSAVEQLEPLYMLAPRLQRIVRWSDDAAQQLRESLSRVVSRQGCIISQGAALSLVVAALGRAERQLAERVENSMETPRIEAVGL